MERVGRLQAIQEDESGWGLEIPSQIREENDTFFDVFVKDLVKHSSKAFFESEVREAARNRDGELWRRAIFDRMDCLQERCSAYKSTSLHRNQQSKAISCIGSVPGQNQTQGKKAGSKK